MVAFWRNAPLRSSFPRKRESSALPLIFASGKAKSFHSPAASESLSLLRAKKVTKESTLRRFNGVFAEATSLCLRRTAHFLCAVEDVASLG
jgi:hypothetical protein